VGTTQVPRRAEVTKLLEEYRDELEQMGVLSLALFGSVARDEAGPDSDVDLLVEIRRPMGLFEFVGIQQRLEQILGRPVDLATRESLKPRLRDRILRAAQPDEWIGSHSDMSNRDWRVYIDDMLEAIEKIQQYLSGMSYQEFIDDRRTVDAVTMNVAILGEATGRVPTEVKDRYPQIPWRLMRDMRNVMIHGYRELDLQTVWDTSRNNLPPLVPLLREMLEREP
jgi:uncharacterized protein